MLCPSNFALAALIGISRASLWPSVDWKFRLKLFGNDSFLHRIVDELAGHFLGKEKLRAVQAPGRSEHAGARVGFYVAFQMPESQDLRCFGRRLLRRLFRRRLPGKRQGERGRPWQAGKGELGHAGESRSRFRS